IGISHFLPNRVDHLIEKRLFLPKQSPVPDCSSNDLAKHIPTPLVRRNNAIAYQESCRSRMIGDDSKRRRISSIRDRSLIKSELGHNSYVDRTVSLGGEAHQSRRLHDQR